MAAPSGGSGHGEPVRTGVSAGPAAGKGWRQPGAVLNSWCPTHPPRTPALPPVRPSRPPWSRPPMRTLRPLLAAAVLALPAVARADELLPADRPIPAAIDHYIDALLKQDGVTPARQADDATLVRRLTLDLVGRIPT